MLVPMTTVEIHYRYAPPLTEQVALALARTRDVYGVRALALDREAHTLRVEFDATRLNAATVTRLIAQAGLRIAEELSLIPPPAPQPEPAPAAS
ncbi:MAG TPA: hypothetical protein VMD55_12825 [Terracidiphilus sp.]|nr:hypothetical protein [Terracidiphilus sp.]